MTDGPHSKSSSCPAAPTPSPPHRSRLDIGEAAAIFVGVCALGVSLYTALLQKAQVRAQVYPQLTINLGLSEDEVKFSVHNKGIGPAKVRSIEVFSADGGNVKTYREWLALLMPSGRSDGGEDTKHDISADQPDTVAAGEEVTFFSLKDIRSDDVIPVARRARQFQISLCYCSVLNDCWQVHDNDAMNDDAKETSSCPKVAAPFVGVDKTKLRDTEYW